MYLLPALLTSLPFIPFTTKEITSCTTEAAKGANKVPRNPLYYFFISCFTVSVTPLINTLESSNEFIILVIPFISSFKINRINPFPALTATFPLIFLSNLLITFEVKLLKELQNFLVLFFLQYLAKNQKIHLTGVSVEIFFSKAFPFLVVCLVVRTNLCSNSSSSKFFLFNLNNVPVLFYTVEFNFFNCVFVSLTFASW